LKKEVDYNYKIMEFLEKDIDITNLSNFKTKAFSRFYFEINTRQDIDKLINIVDFANREELAILFVSWGTNMLFAFNKYNWVIVKNNLKWWTYNNETKILEAYSSEAISDIAKSLEYDFWQDMWHRFIWLPWTIAWAVFWNAWCFWLETENNFSEVEVLNLETRQIEILSKKDMNFSYRSSILKETGKFFIIKVIFDLSKKIEKYSSNVDNIDFRENKQPKWNTCWSFFKNPSKEYSAWYLIEQVGLKWFKLWGAFFSDLHANFLMNDETSSYKDLLDLIKLAQDKVKNEFDIELVPEVRIIYN